MRYIGMNLQRIAEKIMSKNRFIWQKVCMFHLKFSFTIGDVSKVLYLAMFYYTNG